MALKNPVKLNYNLKSPSGIKYKNMSMPSSKAPKSAVKTVKRK